MNISSFNFSIFIEFSSFIRFYIFEISSSCCLSSLKSRKSCEKDIKLIQWYFVEVNVIIIAIKVKDLKWMKDWILWSIKDIEYILANLINE